MTQAQLPSGNAATPSNSGKCHEAQLVEDGSPPSAPGSKEPAKATEEILNSTHAATKGDYEEADLSKRLMRVSLSYFADFRKIQGAVLPVALTSS
jgi:hypothetical protein